MVTFLAKQECLLSKGGHSMAPDSPGGGQHFLNCGSRSIQTGGTNSCHSVHLPLCAVASTVSFLSLNECPQGYNT